MAQFEPANLKRGEEGDPLAFHAKLNGAGANDMCNMQELTKDSILGLLKDRFRKEIVYTYVGDIVVSVNPFKNVGCVGKAIRNKYKKGGAQNAQLLMPHVYHLVDQTYAQMMMESKSQSILISGESGAGKTEAMKIALTYIGEVSVKPGAGKGGGDKAEADPVAARLMMTNPIMEAIGNAKTVRNNNSSRFGKHFDMQFDEKGSILGAFTSIYLLEKPRITEHMKGERNYHIFYMICKAGPEVRDPVNCKEWQQYQICSQLGTVAEVTSWNDNAEFKDMHIAYIKLGFSEQQRTELYMLFSFCLQLGNVNFEENDAGEGCLITTPEQLELSAEMLQVGPEDLGTAITSKTMGGGVIEVFIKPLEIRQANGARNSLIQYIYCLLFDWCTDVVNDFIAVANSDFCIGVLDIFGFENFVLNSFPQLCINFTNESLHNLFIEHVFKLEQETYIREEVDWQFVEYEDNQPTIDLISKRPVCLMGLLDEGCATGSGTDASVLSNYNGVFKDPKKHKNYIKPKKSADKCFCVSHYAGEVTYDITGFVEKNKDELSADIEELLCVKTKFETLQGLTKRDLEKKADADAAKASGKKSKGGGGKKKKTVSRTFGESLVLLMTKLRATEHHYIRCLKPNQTLKAGDWDNEFMFRQLAYSGTLEVTEIRKAGLNVRRPLAHFYRDYKICADDQSALRAGTVTKRTELLLDMLGIDENKWRVGKTLVFLKDYEIMDQLDKLREEKIVEYVIILQAYFRMCKDLQFFRRFRKKVCRIQGFIKTQVVREAFEEVCQATRIVQKYARRRIYANVYAAIMEEFRPKEAGEEMDVAKAREALGKALMKLNPELNFFSKDKGEARGSKAEGKGRGSGQGGGGGRRASLSDDPTMPRFRNRHKAWLTASFGKDPSSQPVFAYMRLGMFTLFKDEQLTNPLISFALSSTTLEASDSSFKLTSPLPPKLAELAARKAAKAKDKKAGKPVEKPKAAAEEGAEGEGEGAKKEAEAAVDTGPALTVVTESIELSPPATGEEQSGLTPADRLNQFKKKLEEGILEARSMDSDLNLAFNLGVDTEGESEEDKLEVVTEGYLHSKFLKLDDSVGVDQKMLGKAWAEHTDPWARAYFVLLNNGKLKYYESAGAAGAPASKRVELGEINLRLFAVSEVDEAVDAKEMAGDKGKDKGKDKKDKKNSKPVEMKIEGEFYSLVKGKQFELRCGRLVFRLASGVPAIADEWLNTLTAATTTMYQKSPIFAQNFIKVHLLNGEVSRQIINEQTICGNLVKRMCKEFAIANDGEWGLYELWDQPDLPGMPGMKERKVPNMEVLLDQTMLKWEVATRIRWGMVAAMPESSFKLVLRKSSSLTPATRSKEEMALEYRQAIIDYREGAFTTENANELTAEGQEVWEIACLAAFKDAFDKRLAEAAAQEEEGGLTAERQRELARTLEHNIQEIDPADIDGRETEYLPAAWFQEEVEKPKKLAWRKKICEKFHEILVEEIPDTIDVPEGEPGHMSVTRRLLFEYRQESDPNAYSIMNLLVDRVRRAPRCFAMQFMAHLWSQARTHAVVLQVNYMGLHIYTPGETLALMCSFQFHDSLVSYLALNDMLTVHVVHKPTKRSAKLHFLTREAMVIKSMLQRYADAVLHELQKLDKERANREKLKGAA
jgi:hypothetical protein